MCDNGFRDHGARPMGENLRAKHSGQRRTIQSARSRSGGASNPPAADAATPFFKGGGFQLSLCNQVLRVALGYR